MWTPGICRWLGHWPTRRVSVALARVLDHRQVWSRGGGRVQIIEHSITGTRSAVLRLRRQGSAMQFVVFPMLHIGRPEFYQAVAERLRECDLLIVEGMHGTSPLIRALTSTYRVVPGNRGSGL